MIDVLIVSLLIQALLTIKCQNPNLQSLKDRQQQLYERSNKARADRRSTMSVEEKKLLHARQAENRRQKKLDELNLSEEEREKIYEHRRRVQREYVRKRVKTEEEKERLRAYAKRHFQEKLLKEKLKREEDKLNAEMEKGESNQCGVGGEV